MDTPIVVVFTDVPEKRTGISSRNPKNRTVDRMGKDMVECIRSRQGKVGYKMKRYPLPTNYVLELQKHPYIEKATPWTVTFSAEFKQLAYDEYMRGKSMREIFSHAGFDVQKLGAKRLENFREHLISKANDAGGFTDKRTDKRLQAPPSTEAQMMKRIRELEHRNAYLEQENDFLKKMQELEKAYDGKAGKRK